MEERNKAPQQGLGLDWKNPIEAQFQYMNRKQRLDYVRAHDKLNRKWPDEMAPQHIPEDIIKEGKVVGSWRSRHFMCNAWASTVPLILCRLSINRVDIDPNTGSWLGGIPWDELYRIKNECGFSGYDAVEVFPAADKLVNVANMRHLWVMKARLPFGLV